MQERDGISDASLAHRRGAPRDSLAFLTVLMLESSLLARELEHLPACDRRDAMVARAWRRHTRRHDRYVAAYEAEKKDR